MNEIELLEAFERLQQAQRQVLAENDQLRRENAQLRQENGQLREVVSQLMERVKKLEAQAAKDSHNSSKPPSSNGFQEPRRKTKNLRGKSGKKSGGHPGQTLRMVEEPDQVIVRQPEQCPRCQHNLAEVSARRVERFQVVDLPQLELAVTEYQAQVKVCPCCQAETRAALPDGMSPVSVQYGQEIKALAVYLTLFQLLHFF